MPYDLIADFAQAVAVAVNAHPGAYVNRQGNAIAGTVHDPDVINAFAVYEAACHTNLQSLVLGRWVAQADEAQPGIDLSLRNNFREMHEADAGGSVMSSQNWTILMNDAWVIGGVHAHTPFYLASPRTQANIQAAPPRGVTVTGRELIGVSTFGYEFVHAHPDLGEAARLAGAGAGAANAASFTLYLDHVAAALDNGALRPATLANLTAPSIDISNEHAH
jgi:hypothetical protein